MVCIGYGVTDRKGEKIKEEKGTLVSIVMGSDSDLPIMEEAASILEEGKGV
ncbi:MAG: hypothetical protein JRD89_17390 [Deltaproteobacteria bacterium]|nr:hypothetical protein [Deltaproteobacteria bacterium]